MGQSGNVFAGYGLNLPLLLAYECIQHQPLVSGAQGTPPCRSPRRYANYQRSVPGHIGLAEADNNQGMERNPGMANAESGVSNHFSPGDFCGQRLIP